MKNKLHGLLLISCLAIHLHADVYGVAEAIALAGATTVTIQTAEKSVEDYRKELEKTVRLQREILKSELTRNMYLTNNLFYLEKLRTNFNRGIDGEMAILRGETLNNKIWVLNNSLELDNISTLEK